MSSSSVTFDIKLIKAVENESCLYDPTLKDYRDANKRNYAWERISEIVGDNPMYCKKRFRVLRDKYVKRRNETFSNDGSTTERSIWECEHMFSFLDGKITTRKPKTIKRENMEINSNNIPIQFIECPLENTTTTYYTPSNEQVTSNTSDLEECDQNHIQCEEQINFNQEHELIEDEDDQNCYNNTTLQHHSLNSRPKTIKAKKRMKISSTQISTYVADSQNSFEQMDEIDYFAKMISAQLRRLGNKNCSKAKLKIMEVLHQTEFEDF